MIIGSGAAAGIIGSKFPSGQDGQKKILPAPIRRAGRPMRLSLFDDSRQALTHLADDRSRQIGENHPQRIVIGSEAGCDSDGGFCVSSGRSDIPFPIFGNDRASKRPNGLAADREIRQSRF